MKTFTFTGDRIAGELVRRNHWKARLNYPAVYGDPWLAKQLERIRYMGLEQLTAIDPEVFERLAIARTGEKTTIKPSMAKRRFEPDFNFTVKYRVILSKASTS